MFGADGRVCCLELALRGERRSLLASHWVQEAMQRAWHRASRYNFWVSFLLFTILVVCTSLVGWLSTGHIGFVQSVNERAFTKNITLATSTADWFDGLVNTFVPVVGPPCDAAGVSAMAPEDAWYALDAIRVRRVIRAVEQCGPPTAFASDLTQRVCAHFIESTTLAATTSEWITVPLHDVAQAQETLRMLAGQWLLYAAERAGHPVVDLLD